MPDHDLAALPCRSMVIAVDGRNDRGPVRVPAGAIRQPHGNDQSPVAVPDAMPGTGGDHLPVVLLPESLEGLRNVDWLGKRIPVVLGPHVIRTLVRAAEQEMHRA